ncbi:hypothetical protein [Actinomyces lilanjuaniae]|nr:hypothetical protein [Actinomyces lilanjuaniae]
MSSTNSASSPGGPTTPSEPPRATSTPDTSGSPSATEAATEPTQAADAGMGSGTTAPVGAASSSSESSESTDTVWSAGTTTLETTSRSPGRVQGSTLLWGSVLLLVGSLLVATGLGVSLDPTTTAIVCLGGIGVMLVILALVPRRTGQG